ncbi:LysR family transcriptional regulator [Pseudomonas benzenivorans]|uniref:LysR family transcriptional regulator n=1 Tax=Pseudomonas benzenivorans TaxID=556533 RepID=A0ABY5HBF0_9PSED|nr:LysR family transcriptional regulator [Pseudomonas benzenivorans]UTW09518.1 LysR family transcriptional regulator [Pseudomonas benzenivorans]
MALPSLNLLRTFAVLGDTLNVRRAAERLHVTPTAVSHQLRDLEAALDCRLFQRLPRGLALTDAGRSFWAEVAPAIRQLEAASRARQVRRPFRISSFPFLAQSVVLPALGELQALLGERLLSLDTRREILDLEGHGIDLGLRFAVDPAHWGELRARRLSGFQLTPLVAAAFPDVPWPPTDELLPVRLSKEQHGWGQWAAVHGWQPASDGLELDSYAAVLNATEQGLGVAIGFLPLCINALQRGGLRPLWPGREVSGGALWAVWPAAAETPALLRVVDRLEQRLAEMEARSAEFFSVLGG